MKKLFFKHSIKEAKAAELQDSITEYLTYENYTPNDEDFEKAGFDEKAAERTGYTNYSYWRSTFSEFRKHRVAMVLLFIMVAIIIFTFIQPLISGTDDQNTEGDPTFHYSYEKIEKNKWGETKISTTVDNAPPYIEYQFKKLLSKIGIVDENDEYFAKYEEAYARNGRHFLLGTNKSGQDLWLMIWAGTRTSLIIGICVALIEAFFGIIAGVMWGYIRKLDFFFTELYNVIDNIPNTLLLILIALAYSGRTGISTLILAMSLTGWIQMGRFIRNQILVIRDRDYNTASRCLGTPTFKILMKNCLPYLVSVVMLRMALTIPAAIGSEVFVSYIGLGLPEKVPSLGKLIVEGRKVFTVPELRFLLTYPTIILSFVTVSFYVIGNAFSDSADPKNHK